MRSSLKLTALNQQRGIVGILAAIFLITAVIFVLTQSRYITATVSLDNAQQRDSTAAFFLAESGAENAQALLTNLALSGKSVYQACNSLSLNTPVALGDGTYQYTSAVPLDTSLVDPTTCTSTCRECVLTVQGSVGHATRSINVSMAASGGAGIEGYDSTFTLTMKAETAPTFAFTHLAFNPPSNWTTTGTLTTCGNAMGGTLLPSCSQSWNIQGTQYNNTSSEAVFAQLSTPGTYSLTQSLTEGGAASKEDFVEVGVLMRPISGSSTITHKGSYATAPSSGSSTNCPSSLTSGRTMPVTANCSSSDYQHGYLPANWTCNANNGTTATWSNAGNADTLMIGFGGKPYSGGTVRTSRLSAIRLNGQQFHNQVEMVGTQKVTGGDGRAELQYSQLWYVYNPGYYASTANATNIPTVSFTGAVGAQFTGYIGTLPASVTGSVGASVTGSISGTTLTVSNVSSGVLSVGDVISGGTIRSNTTITAFGTGTGGRGTYTVSGSAQTITSRTITAASNVLNVTAVASGQLIVGGAVSSNASGTDISSGTTIAAFGTGTGGVGTYTLSGSKLTVTSRTVTQASAASTTLTVTDITSSGLGGQLRVGDTLSSTGSGTNVASNTTITAFGTGTGGVGTYTVSSSQSVTSRTISASSRILRVSAVASGTLAEGAQITSGMGACTTSCPTIQPLSTTGTTGTGLVGDYVLGQQYSPVSSGQSTSMTASTGSTGTTTITLSGATTVPVVGTALSVVSGTGQYLPHNVTASISGTTMTVTAATGTPGLSAGDALFGQFILPQTTIVNQITPLTVGESTGGIGRYTVSNNHTATPSAIVTARAAVVAVTSANSFTVSRLPESPGVLSGAQLCGGVCPFLKSDGATTVGQFTLTGVQDYDDWSGGFACLQGVDPASILNAAQVVTKRTRWREVVQ